MKPFYATILAAALLLTASPLFAEDSKIDLKKLSCKQFSGYDKDNMSIIMMWLEGYYTGDPAIPAHLLVYCGDHPDDDIITAAEDVLGKD